MEPDLEMMPIEHIIKIEPEQFQNAVFLQQAVILEENSIKDESPAEIEAIYVKVEDNEPQNEIAIVKLEPQASLQPVIVLERISESEIYWWTRWKYRKFYDRKRRNCDICGKSIADRNTMIVHLEIHFKDPHLFCDLCPRSYRDRKGLEIHMSSHLPEKPFKCNRCGFSTIYKHSLFLHRGLHRRTLTECHLCHKMVTVLRTHIKRTHDRKDKQVQCEVCGKTMVVHKLARHTSMVHAKNRKCPKCDEMCNTRGLRIHMLKAHYKGKLVECSECDAVFKDNASLTTHMGYHSGRTSCGVCQRKYSGEVSLQRHWNDKHRTSLGSIMEWRKKQKKKK